MACRTVAGGIPAVSSAVNHATAGGTGLHGDRPSRSTAPEASFTTSSLAVQSRHHRKLRGERDIRIERVTNVTLAVGGSGGSGITTTTALSSSANPSVSGQPVSHRIGRRNIGAVDKPGDIQDGGQVIGSVSLSAAVRVSASRP